MQGLLAASSDLEWPRGRPQRPRGRPQRPRATSRSASRSASRSISMTSAASRSASNDLDGLGRQYGALFEGNCEPIWNLCILSLLLLPLLQIKGQPSPSSASEYGSSFSFLCFRIWVILLLPLLQNMGQPSPSSASEYGSGTELNWFWVKDKQLSVEVRDNYSIVV